jgi:PAS domain S-box-containing protein
MSSPTIRRSGASSRVPTAAPDFACTIAPNGFLARAGGAFQEITGRSAETLTSRPLAEFVHEADRGTLAAALEWSDPEGEPLLFEVRFRHADGSYRWLEWTVAGRPGDEVRRAAVRDVTRWKRDEALALAHARALESVVAEQPLPETLGAVAGLLEAIGLDFVAMVHVAAADGQALELAWGPALPEPLRRAVERLALAGGPGAAVAASQERKLVATPDLALETHWRGRRELPLAHGLRAEWAQPVLDAAGLLRGALTVFLTQPALPAPRDRQILSLAVQLVATALDRDARRAGAALAEARLAEEQRAAAARVRELESGLAELTAALDVARAEMGNVGTLAERAQAEARDALQARLALEAALEVSLAAAEEQARRRADAEARAEAVAARAAALEGAADEAEGRAEAAERRAAERTAALEAQLADLEARAAVAEAAWTVREEEVEAERRAREEAAAALARAREEAAEALAWAHEEAEAAEAEHAREREAAAAERGAIAEEAASIASAREALTAEVGAVRARLVDAEALLREMEAGREALRAELARVRGEADGTHASLREAGSALRAERDALRSEREALLADAGRMHRELEALRLEVATHRAELENLRFEVEVRRGELEGARAELATLRVDAGAARATLERERDEARRERDDARGAWQVVQRELEALRDAAAQLVAELEATRGALAASEARHEAEPAAGREQLEQALWRVQHEAEAERGWAQAELDMLGLRVTELEAGRAGFEAALRVEAAARLEAEERRRADAETALRDAHRALEELPQLRAQLTMAERRVAELEGALREAQERAPAALGSSDVDEDLAALHARLAEADGARQRLEAALAEARRDAEDARRALDFERARCVEENDRLSARLAEAETARVAASPAPRAAAAAATIETSSDALDLSALVERLRGELAAMLGGEAQLHVRLTPHLPPVAGDPASLRQVLAQLVSNAAEALEGRRGVISVATGVVDADRPYLKSAYFDDGLPEGRYAFLEVSDTGHGMTPEVQRRLFDAGFSTRDEGRGRGLPLALGLVRAHEGAIQVYTKPDVGTTIRVLLPVATLARQRRGEEAAPAEAARRAATAVLVVDRDATMRAAAARILERWGFTVLEAADFEAGATVLRDAAAVRLVLMEAGLPSPEGPATTALHALRGDLRVLLAGEPNGTGNGEGAAAVVARPFAPVELVAAVRAALGTAAPGGAGAAEAIRPAPEAVPAR